ncbi:MAG: VOC family protein [Alphaproteobacteria bacterium]|nr:VOC family protein [Alphaproteobacteria bacterium]
MPLRPFHLAFPVRDLEEARRFYCDRFGCTVGRDNPHSIVFNFYGHQVVAHLAPEVAAEQGRNAVDSRQVPVRHFGIVLTWDEWHALADRLKGCGTEFVIEPYIRYKGKSGEQATMFFLDPSGNALEFKAFKDDSGIFSPWREGEGN